MPELNKPLTVTRWFAYDDNVLHQGLTTPSQVTSTNLPNLDTAITEDDVRLKAGAIVDKLPLLPIEGEEVHHANVYNYEGNVVIIRKSHKRTNDDPTNRPDLFIIGDVIPDWIEDELVLENNVRNHSGLSYIAVEAHETEVGIEPPNDPLKWSPL